MLRGKPGYGGTNPCGQKAGEKKFYEEFQNPVDLLLNGDYRHIPVFFGANSHEGGEVVKGNFKVFFNGYTLGFNSLYNRSSRLWTFDISD